MKTKPLAAKNVKKGMIITVIKDPDAPGSQGRPLEVVSVSLPFIIVEWNGYSGRCTDKVDTQRCTLGIPTDEYIVAHSKIK